MYCDQLIYTQYLLHKIEDLYLKAYKKTLTDKEHGIIRNKMDGKTITCSSRTVIIPEPKYPVTHGTIPRMLAKASTIRETVTETNIELLRNLMQEGKIKVVFPGNSQIDSKVEVEKGKIYTLNIGDKIDREILDGDKSIFDRPPTLHEAGVVPVTIVIDDTAHFSFYESDEQKNENIFVEIIRNQEGYVVGLHLGLTVAKAADFDGDEDSVVYPQHEDSRAEMDGIQHIENYLIDGQGQKVAFAPVQDALLGCYVATKYSLPVNWRANHKRKYTADDLLTSVQLMETYTYLSKERFVDFARMLDDPLVERKQPYISKVVEGEFVQGRVNISDDAGEIEFSGPFIDALKKNGLDFVVDGVIPAVHLLSFILPDNMTFKN
jgi:DNA-directed RNA polymerase beta' subunit